MGNKLVGQMLGMCDQLVADAAAIVGPYDDAEIEAFAAELCGLGGLSWEEQQERTADLVVPSDFRHLRLTNLDKDQPWGGIYDSFQSPLDFASVLRVTSIHAERDDVLPSGRGVWVETVALPVRDPGVLELGLRFAALN